MNDCNNQLDLVVGISSLNGESSLTCKMRLSVIPALQIPIAAKPPIMRGRRPSFSMVKHCGGTSGGIINRRNTPAGDFHPKSAVITLLLSCHANMRTFASCNISYLWLSGPTNEQQQLHPDESSDDLYDPRSCRGVLDFRRWDPSVLEDVIGVKPDLWWKVRCTLVVAKIIRIIVIVRPVSSFLAHHDHIGHQGSWVEPSNSHWMWTKSLYINTQLVQLRAESAPPSSQPGGAQRMYSKVLSHCVCLALNSSKKKIQEEKEGKRITSIINLSLGHQYRKTCRSF